MIRYEVINKEVFAWDDSVNPDVPFLHQPFDLDGAPFASNQEAQEWADKWYYEATHPEESEWWQSILALKEIAKAKVIAGEQITQEEADALAATLN